MRTQHHPMTNEVTSGKVAATGISVLAAATSYLPHIEAILRIGASFVSIIAGCIVIWPHVRKMFRKRKHK